MRGRSGLQALDGPAITLSHVFEAIVQPAWPPLPEFNPLGNHPVTTPETGQGDFAGAELAFHLRHFLFQQAPGSNRLALLRYPGANLAAPWPGGEVFQGFRLADLFHRPLNTYLTVQADPGKQQRCLGVLLQFQCLAAAVIGVEHKAPVIEVFQQHGAQVRHLVGTGGGQRHSVGLKNTCGAGIFKPGLELQNRVVVQVFAIQPFTFKIPTHIADVHTALSVGLHRECYVLRGYRVQCRLSGLADKDWRPAVCLKEYPEFQCCFRGSGLWPSKRQNVIWREIASSCWRYWWVCTHWRGSCCCPGGWKKPCQCVQTHQYRQHDDAISRQMTFCLLLGHRPLPLKQHRSSGYSFKHTAGCTSLSARPVTRHRTGYPRKT